MLEIADTDSDILLCFTDHACRVVRAFTIGSSD